jgi:hypothetical protein
MDFLYFIFCVRFADVYARVPGDTCKMEEMAAHTDNSGSVLFDSLHYTEYNPHFTVRID